ncbi:COX5B-domain-containing protein [Wallemia mellicola]|uniref:COX5B-domain-containing protein n=2 Tax=Wallemia mellicola TaxID=1708541 RepID=A0A4T0P8Q0_9BASI|nr:COX5B-domain-containing protein [Wallemia mellicola CBS 633.66]TIB72714.1 hypothetical protein E3Q23_03287 [Wallemia mellicola]EIM22243.1 COX5B-domain-containing protein [Wallemia mellicola CBS 633.66]TIB73419.1 hypothetical protein E3Q24_01189 [Wallemia mellicola]TIB80921.1 COX5B-domain-containing protein [Wallemia mellicola]TIB86011.1 COX5B-domain-containing protein [Wallemia mellicola]|eukprot:XP_006957507.1 COX5B-domain-containing protein [Wallemia mellicola CBS 633.66]
MISQLRSAVSRNIATVSRQSIRPSIVSRRNYSAAPPSIYGPGAEDGTVPTDEDQATGIERMELLAKAQGSELFDMQPLKVDRMGTMKDPIIVPSLTPIRIVGSTGYPVDSNDTVWLTLDVRVNDGIGRCPESGVVYKLDYQGAPLDEHHH